MDGEWDISVEIGAERFHFRVAGILIDRDRVLVNRQKNDSHWALPGGRVTMMETTGETIVREIKEDLAIKVSLERKAFPKNW